MRLRREETPSLVAASSEDRLGAAWRRDQRERKGESVYFGFCTSEQHAPHIMAAADWPAGDICTH